MAEKDRIGEAKMDDEITMKIERIEELLSSFAVNGLMDTASISTITLSLLWDKSI